MVELPRLYAITDREAYGENFLSTLEEVLAKGVKMLQLRDKRASGRELYRLALKVRELTREYGALLLINERLDVAVAVGADGVHLPERSLPPGIVKRLYPDMLVGYSAHSESSVLFAQEQGADFVTFGPVFRTRSHPEVEPVGTIKLREVAQKVNIPVFALGGVTWDRIKLCYKNYAYGVAGITMFLHDTKDQNAHS